MSSTTWFASALSASVPLFAATLLFAPAVAAADRPDTQPTVVEEIVAKVNGEIVTRGELDKQRLVFEAELRQQGLIGQALQDGANKRVADGLRDQIDQLLLVQKGKELSINVDADVNRRIAQIQSDSKISDPDKFHTWLQEQTGETFEDFKQLLKNTQLSQRVISEEVYRNIIIPKAEIDKYYNEHKTEFIRQEMVLLREILVSTGDGSPEKVAAAEKKAKGLVDKARKGEAKFPDLARQYSDASTATSDGELGAFKRGDLAKEIDEVVFKNAKGYVTDPIRRPAGFEIYRVEEHYAAGQASEDEVESDINAKLMEPRAGAKVREYLTQLRQNAFLQIKPGYVDSAAAPGKDTTWQDPGAVRAETTTKEAVASHAHKKFLHVIPYGHVGEAKDTSPAPPPTVTPVQQTPVQVPPVPVTPQ
jgi:peptidyl-prolyl cis-trans isomerase SurA